MAPNNRNIPPVSARSESSISTSRASKKLKQLIQINSKLDLVIKRIDILEEVIKEHCTNISDKIRMGGWRNPHYKTKLCIYYENGDCYRGKFCQFAHGESELRSNDFLDNL